MLVRECRLPDDYEAAIALWKIVGMFRPEMDSLATLQYMAERNPGLFMVAEDDDGRLVGTVMGTFDGRRGYLYHVAVHPDARRHRIGSKLIKEVEARLWALGATKIRFMVQKNNTSAQAFYETLGFSADSTSVPMNKTRPTEASNS